MPGAGGTIGLSQLSRMDGDSSTVMVTGTVMLGGIAISPSGLDLSEMTPVARLAEDFEVVAVPADSDYETLEDFIADWEQDPAALPVGGGSAGGIDHMVAALLAREAGIDPSQVQYSAFAGGGDLTISLLSTAPGTPGVGISGFNDFRDLIEDGRLRALAVVAPERLEGLDVPTMEEVGYPGVDLVNWRGIIAPADLTPQEHEELIDIVEEMVQTPEWQGAVDRNRWEESLLTGAEFGDFLVTEQERITEILLDLGLIQ